MYTRSNKFRNDASREIEIERNSIIKIGYKGTYANERNVQRSSGRPITSIVGNANQMKLLIAKHKQKQAPRKKVLYVGRKTR